VQYINANTTKANTDKILKIFIHIQFIVRDLIPLAKFVLIFVDESDEYQFSK
jgi:hypothetical protein